MILSRLALGLTGGLGGAYVMRENEYVFDLVSRLIQHALFRTKQLETVSLPTFPQPKQEKTSTQHIWGITIIGVSVFAIYRYFPNLQKYMYVTKYTFLKGLSTVRDSINTLTDHVTGLKSQILGVTKQIDHVDRSVLDLKKSSETNFEEIVNNMECITSRLDRVDQGIHHVGSNVRVIDDKIDRVDNKINTIHQHVVDPTNMDSPSASSGKKSLPTAMQQLLHFTKQNKKNVPLYMLPIMSHVR